MRPSALIYIALAPLLLGACVSSPPSVPQGVNPAPVMDSPLPPGGGYLDPATLNLYRLLPPPPVAGSPQERADLDELLRLQATRTPADVKLAQEDQTQS